MIDIISYNERELKQRGSIADIQAGYNVWADLVNPTQSEILSIYHSLHLDKLSIEQYLKKSKKPQVRILDNQKFAIALDIKFKDASTLETHGVYLFSGRGWLVSIHSDKVDLRSKIMTLFEQKNKAITESSIDALFYNILANLVNSYEQLLTAIELTVADFEQKSLYRPSKKMLQYLDSLSRQVIILRRHFWHMRDVINYMIHTLEDTKEVKYLRIVYDDVTQLIEMVESYRDTINSTRELYIANVSLQMSDAMKTLTIFSAILLPLTFITSMYGMNGVDLKNLSNLPAGFAVIAATMAIVTVGLFIYFKKKQWILVGNDESIRDRVDKQDKHEESFESFFGEKERSDQKKYSAERKRAAETIEEKISDSEAE